MSEKTSNVVINILRYLNIGNADS